MNTTFRGAKGDYVLDLTNRAEKGSQRTNAGIYFGPASQGDRERSGTQIRYVSFSVDCHRTGEGHGPLTNRLFTLGRALRLPFRLQDLHQLSHLFEQLFHRFAILLGFLFLLI
jgi:hypothetical protein